MIQFCKETAGYEDVLALCEAEVESQQPKPNQELAVIEESPDGLVQGFVYLIKSGLAHKIGSTSAVERRINELSYQSPQPTELVHQISTDDKNGIEKYWHRRFESKRIRGEWFNLTAADVAAFRKRKFM